MNIKSYQSILFVTFFSLLLITAKASGATWTTEVVDSSGDVGGVTSLALDSSDNVHISYLDWTYVDLKYATNASGSWVTQTVSSGYSGQQSSLALDSSGNAHISYFGAYPNYDFKYATDASGSWVTQTVDSSASLSFITSLALDSLGNAHISYGDINNQDLKYATNASGSWVTQTLYSGNVLQTNFNSLALDSSGNVHISHFDGTNSDLKYTTNASGSWATVTVDSSGDVGWYTSLALDSSGKVYISYYDKTDTDLKYATNITGSWVTQTVYSGAKIGSSTSIALDSAGKVHISYFDWLSYHLKYTTDASGSWATVTVDSSGLTGEASSIALDSADKVHISYVDILNLDLKYATNQVGVSCPYSLSLTSATFDTPGGTGNVSVTTTSGCNWTATSNAPSWITINSPIGSITGNGTVNYSVSPNTGTGSRTGTMTIAGKTFTVIQGASITADIKAANLDGAVALKTDDAFPISVGLVAGSGEGIDCDWWVVAATSSSWYYFDLGTMGWKYAGGSYADLSFTYQGPLFDLSPFVISNLTGLPEGTYTFYFAVDTNMNGLLDLDKLFFDFVTVNINNSCTYSISPATVTVSIFGGNGSVNVGAQGSCNWTAKSNASWIFMESDGVYKDFGHIISRSGNGNVNYSVSPNNKPVKRTGTITVAGQTFTVVQAGDISRPGF